MLGTYNIKVPMTNQDVSLGPTKRINRTRISSTVLFIKSTACTDIAGILWLVIKSTAQ
jgi:hypothetical protein